jgi:hypothetical protein
MSKQAGKVQKVIGYPLVVIVALFILSGIVSAVTGGGSSKPAVKSAATASKPVAVPSSPAPVVTTPAPVRPAPVAAQPAAPVVPAPASSSAKAQAVVPPKPVVQANAVLPDGSLTPGAVLTTSAANVCTSGWSSAHRDVSESLRQRVFAEYGIPWSQHSLYETDHLISLELGGSNSIANLWPEKNDHPQGAINTKDLLENKLHNLVCSGSLSLPTAQSLIRSNWSAAYRTYGGAHFSSSTASSAPAAPPPKVVQTYAPKPVQTVAPQQTTPAPSGDTVHPGSFCAPAGATGVSKTGKSEICGPASDGRNRWHAR